MAIPLILLAAIFASASNFFMRKSVDSGGTTKAFLLIQLSIGFFAAILLNPMRLGSYAWNLPVIVLGLFAGIVFGMMMQSLGRALEKGPPGLTIATLNASTIMPGLIMAIIFGTAFGYGYNSFHAVGSLLVLLGLFWAGWGFQGMKNWNTWLIFSLGAFSFHTLFLIFMQWRALMINNPDSVNYLRLMSSVNASSEWFMPMIYFSAAALQSYVFISSEKRWPSNDEWRFGSFGGIANACSVFFLIRSTEIANSLENAMIFPIFSVAIVLICNSWGKWIYQEKVNWKACHMCVSGLFLGTVDWEKVWSFLGM